MYRKIMSFLQVWKESEYRKPLIIQGARQVGKTYSILEFGRTCYENVAYFNFETNPKLNETFEEYNVPIDVDIKFDPNPISWTLKIPLILFHGHLLILLSG